LSLPGLGKTDLHDWLTDRRSDLIAGRDTNPLMQASGVVADVFNAVVEWLQALVARAELPRPVPEIGWLGVIALAAWCSYAIASWQMALLVTGSFLAFGYLGYWEDSLDTLIITFFSVGLALVVGIPLAVWMATNARVTALVTPVLDVLQTLPSFCYLLPVVLFFGISAPSAVVATLLYALPPVIRIAAHGIRSVSATTIEATDSIGQTPRQRLTKVQLPMAKRTIIVGVNQTTMAALSMATIAALVNGPGLGEPVLTALSAQALGTAFVAGLCIVILAVMLDRVTTAASERTERVARGGGGDPKRRRIVLAATGVVALVLVLLSRTYSGLAQFPESSIGPSIADRVQSWSETVTSALDGVTTAFKDQASALLLNPLQDLLAESPWWLTGLAIMALSLIIAGRRASVTTLVCLALIYASDLWHDAMITLTMTLVGTLMVMVLAVVVGVWMARSRAVDVVVRPVLDAAQVMPPFVYLIPVLAFFGVTRFSAIVAGVVFAAPVAIKLVADGVRAVPATAVEASEACGSSTWQTITKVQLPMARGSIVLAANQGLLYVLSMAVIGGLVGAGALGYDVVLGFSQGDFYGKGLAAGAAIVALGIMLDRIARSAATSSAGRDGPRLRHTRPATL
ncbi:MAG: ABC transporter permease subunit, partial [Actinomycetota bacterium]|nr:ABC transporter permease subunit [Actinomycetota bacterium]